MGKKASKNVKPFIQLVYMGRKMNLYSIPESYYELEAIGYNFYYAYADRVEPFESIKFSFISRGFLRASMIISDKKSYKKALNYLHGEIIQINIEVEKHEWLSSLEFKETDHIDANSRFEKIKELFRDNIDDFIGVVEAYVKLLKISNQFCGYITAHDIKSSLFGILIAVASDSCKNPLKDRYKIIDNFPYIEFMTDFFTETSLDMLRVWNDFMFYLPKCLTHISIMVLQFESAYALLNSISPSEALKTSYLSNLQLVRKSIEGLKFIQERLKKMEDNIKDYSIFLKKPQTQESLSLISSIIDSCGGHGMENVLNLFSIIPFNKYP